MNPNAYRDRAERGDHWLARLAHAADRVVDLLRRADHAARAVDADDDGLDAGVLAVLAQLAHEVVGLGDEALELDDGDLGTEQRAAAVAAAAPRAAREQEEAGHPEEY